MEVLDPRGRPETDPGSPPGRDLTGYGDNLPPNPWPTATRAVVSLAVHVHEGAEPSIDDGDADGERYCEGMFVEAGGREFAIETFFEYGSRCGVWRLLRILDAFSVKATFFCCGRALERNPKLGPRLVESGHEVACHGWRYIPYYDISEADQREEIRKGVEAIRTTCGVDPVGWVSRVPDLSTRRLLVEHGDFLYDCDGYDDDLPYAVDVRGQRLIVVPNAFDSSDEKFWSLPNNSGFTNPENMFNALKDGLDRLVEEGERFPRVLPIALRPRISGKPSKANQLWRFLEYATSVPGVAFLTRREIAEIWTGIDP